MHIGLNAHLLAFTENYRQAGLSRYIQEVALRVPALCKPSTFTAYTSNARVPESFLAAKPANLFLSCSRLPTGSAPMRITWEQTVLPVVAASTRLDLLHCPVNVIPIVRTCPTLVTIHDIIFLRYPENFKPAKRFYLKAMTGWSARHAEHVITVSETTRNDVIRLLHVSPDKITAVHNGVSDQFVQVPEETKQRFMRARGITGRSILYVGTLEPRKNIVTLLEAFAAIADHPDLSDVTLYIGGSKGWYYDEIFATAKRLQLTAFRRIRFIERVPDDELPLWYNVATVFAYPSLYEGFGLPALEAMACGAPVLASNTSSLPEVVGSAGVLLDPKDMHGWAEALRRVLSDPHLAAEMSAKGKAQARKFSWEKTARETVEVYKRVLQITKATRR